MSDVIQHKANKDLITLSERAKQHFIKLLEEEKIYPALFLRLKKTGCSGLSYVFDFLSSIDEKQTLKVSLNQNYTIIIDKASYPYLQGLKIDYVREGLDHKLVYENPNQTGQCGCGESFSIDKTVE